MSEYIKIKRSELEKIIQVVNNGSSSEEEGVSRYGEQYRYPARVGALQSMLKRLMEDAEPIRTNTRKR